MSFYVPKNKALLFQSKRPSLISKTEECFLSLDIKRKGCKLINLLTDEKIIGKMIKRLDNILYRKRTEEESVYGENK